MSGFKQPVIIYDYDQQISVSKTAPTITKIYCLMNQQRILDQDDINSQSWWWTSLPIGPLCIGLLCTLLQKTVTLLAICHIHPPKSSKRRVIISIKQSLVFSLQTVSLNICIPQHDTITISSNAASHQKARQPGIRLNTAGARKIFCVSEIGVFCCKNFKETITHLLAIVCSYI